MNTRHRRLIRVAAALAALTCLLLLAAPDFATRLMGTRWYDMQTASMGTTASVGSLVITEPVNFDDIAVNDIVTFTRPGAESSTYTHRVVARGHDWLETQGDESPVIDPGRRSPADVHGRMVHVVPAAGYALRSLPILFAGLVLSIIVSRLLPQRMRRGSVMLGAAGAVCVASAIHRPFFNVVTASTTPTEDGASIGVVNIGIFPLRAQITDGAHADLMPGEFGALSVTGKALADGAVSITPEMHMGPGWWVIFVLICCTPLLYAIATSLRDRPSRREPDPDDSGTGRLRRAAWLGAGSTLTAALVVAAALVSPANGAFMGRITNAENSVASRTYFDCAGMIAADNPARRFAFGMRTGTTWSTANGYESDLSGNGRHGTWSRSRSGGKAPTRTVSTHPCARDGYSVVNISTREWSLGQDATAANTTANPNEFTIETWFKTSNTDQKIIGFGVGAAGNEPMYDRHLYIGSNGHLYFGVYPDAVKVITTPTPVDDDQWHHAVATLGASGMTLYLDGQQVAQDPTVTTGESYSGQWRIGYGNMRNWTGIANSAAPFHGSLGFTSVSYETVTATEAHARYLAGAP